VFVMFCFGGWLLFRWSGALEERDSSLVPLELWASVLSAFARPFTVTGHISLTLSMSLGTLDMNVISTV
jgi:hypothetical protein